MSVSRSRVTLLRKFQLHLHLAQIGWSMLQCTVHHAAACTRLFFVNFSAARNFWRCRTSWRAWMCRSREFCRTRKSKLVLHSPITNGLVHDYSAVTGLCFDTAHTDFEPSAIYSCRWLTASPAQADAFCSPIVQPVTTYMIYISTRPCVQWAVFVQFILDRRLRCSFRPQHWPSRLNQPIQDGTQ